MFKNKRPSFDADEISFLKPEISFLMEVAIVDSLLRVTPVEILPVETDVPDSILGGGILSEEISSKEIGVNDIPVDTFVDGYTKFFSASISSRQRSLLTSIPFSTHIHSSAVSITLGPYVFAFTRSFFEICSLVHSLYEPSYLFASQKVRPFFEVKESVSAKDCSHNARTDTEIQRIQIRTFFI